MQEQPQTVAGIQAKWDEWRRKINDRSCTEFDWPETAQPRQLGLCEVLVDDLGRLWRVEPSSTGIKMKMMIDPRPPIIANMAAMEGDYEKEYAKPAGYVVFLDAGQ